MSASSSATTSRNQRPAGREHRKIIQSALNNSAHLRRKTGFRRDGGASPRTSQPPRVAIARTGMFSRFHGAKEFPREKPLRSDRRDHSSATDRELGRRTNAISVLHAHALQHLACSNFIGNNFRSRAKPRNPASKRPAEVIIRLMSADPPVRAALSSFQPRGSPRMW